MEQKHVLMLLLIFGAISGFINVLPKFVNIDLPDFSPSGSSLIGFIAKEAPLRSLAQISFTDAAFITITIVIFGAVMTLIYANKKIKMKLYEKKNRENEAIERIKSSLEVYNIDYDSILGQLSNNINMNEGYRKNSQNESNYSILSGELEKIKVMDNVKTLRGFVRNKMIQGLSKESIKKELLKHGWEKSFLRCIDDVKLTKKDIKKMIENSVKESIKQGHHIEHIEEALYKKGWKEETIKPIINTIKMEYSL